MDHPLDDARLNIARAAEHFDALEKEISDWVQANGDAARPSIRHTIDRNTGILHQDIVTFDPVPVVPHEWAGYVFDIANNLRSSLDYLVFELAAKWGGDDKREKKTAFPISGCSEEYLATHGKSKRTYRDTCLIGVPDRWKSEIDKLQPFEPTGRPELEILSDLNNRQKHRRRLRARWRVVTTRFLVMVDSGEFVRSLAVVMDGIGNMQIQADIVKPSRGRQLVGGKMKPNPYEPTGISVCFGERPELTLADLKYLIGSVGSILKIFEPAFDPPV